MTSPDINLILGPGKGFPTRSAIETCCQRWRFRGGKPAVDHEIVPKRPKILRSLGRSAESSIGVDTRPAILLNIYVIATDAVQADQPPGLHD